MDPAYFPLSELEQELGRVPVMGLDSALALAPEQEMELELDLVPVLGPEHRLHLQEHGILWNNDGRTLFYLSVVDSNFLVFSFSSFSRSLPTLIFSIFTSVRPTYCLPSA